MENDSTITVGIDLGDKFSDICVLDENGDVVEETRIKTTESGVRRYFDGRKPMLVVLEVGTHSPWLSRLVGELGHEVLVANPRKVRAIYENDRKDDRTDAEMLARIARVDPKLLCPVKHVNKEVQAARALVRSRAILVRSRTQLVTHVRGSVKSFGKRLPSCSAGSFHRLEGELPADLRPALVPVMTMLAEIEGKIDELDTEIERVSREQYPETSLLRQVSGVGPVTALAFVLTVVDPNLFSRGRDVGAYLGLVPRRSQSGGSDPQLTISRSGDTYLRSLLVKAAHYIIGPFGSDCDLRRHGLRIADRGGKNAKKRAAVAVARKLSVLLLTLWKTGEEYAPVRAEATVEAA